MARIGKITLEHPNIAKWSFRNKPSTGRWLSNSFTVTGFFGSVYFLVDPFENDSRSAKLYLYETTDNKLKACEFSIRLRYTYGMGGGTISCKYCKGIKLMRWNVYYLTDIETNSVCEIVCAFMKVETIEETGNHTGERELAKNVLKELKEDAGEQNEEHVNYENNDLKLESGFAILSGDLKNAFLSEEDSDVILRVGDQRYPAHKVIIRNRSSVFRAMLEHDMTEKNEGIVDIDDCDPCAFRDFLLYLYSGKLNSISNENVFELYYISDKYNVNQLKIDCTDHIVKNLSIDIICDVISLATKHSERDLLKLAIAFFTENAEDIFVTLKWQNFMKDNPVEANEIIIKAFKSDSRKQKLHAQKRKK